MFISSEAIALFFRLFNFALVIALAAYVFYTYILPDVRVSMAHEKSEADLLLNQKKLYDQKHKELNLLIKSDAIECEQFEMRISEWKRAVQQSEFLEKKEAALLINRIQRRRAEEQEWKEKQSTQRQVAYKVLHKLENSLADDFKDDAAQNEYLDKIIHFMNERSL